MIVYASELPIQALIVMAGFRYPPEMGMVTIKARKYSKQMKTKGRSINLMLGYIWRMLQAVETIDVPRNSNTNLLQRGIFSVSS